MANQPPSRIPLFSPLGNRGFTLDTDARIYNGFAEKSADGSEIWVYKRPGTSIQNSPSTAATGRGSFFWDGDVYSIFGGTLYKNTTSLGAVNASGFYTFTSCLGATPKLFLKNTQHAYTYDGGAGLVEVTDGDYPSATVNGCAYLDGTIYVMTPAAAIWGSDENDPQSWTADNFILAQIEPGAGVALGKQLVYLVATKVDSSEVFYDAGNASGSPLGPVQGSKSGFGNGTSNSLARGGDDLFWISTTTEGEFQVIMMSKVHPEVISTPQIERILRNVITSFSYAFAFRVMGHRFYVLTFVSANLTLVFDVQSVSWYIWTDPNGNYWPYCSATHDNTGLPLLQHESNGSMYTISEAQFSDGGSAYALTLYTPPFDGGLRLVKSVSSCEFIADKLAATLSISWSDDDYQTFSTPITLGLNQDRPMWNDGSSFRRRAYKVVCNDSVLLRLKFIEMTAQPGTF